MLKNPPDFGKKLNPEFVDETGENSAQISGAMVQHVFAKGIREALTERGMSLLELSEWTGLNYQRLTRMLRGSVVMRIDDIGIFARHLPEAFDSSVGKYDPRARLSLTNLTPSRLSRIYNAALPWATRRSGNAEVGFSTRRKGSHQTRNRFSPAGQAPLSTPPPPDTHSPDEFWER